MSELHGVDVPRKVEHYRLRAPLGAGGMGVVWEAWDEKLERRVALKQLRHNVDARQRARFRREAKTAARLSHPAIVQIFDLVHGLDEDWIVMEHVEGRTLAALLREGPLPLDRVLRLAREIAEGLAEAHDKGIIHRDLKVENIIVTPGGHAKIMDFGLARPYWGLDDGEKLSRSGEIVGTHRVMSPEQVRGLPLGPRSDLFSLGILLYETVTGVSPFRADNWLVTADRVCNLLQQPAVERNPAVPRALSQLIDALLEKDSDLRPSDARVVVAHLEAIARQRVDSATPVPDGPYDEPTFDSGESTPRPTTTAARRRGRRRWPWLVLPLLIVLAVVLALLLRPGAAVAPTLVVAVAPPRVDADAERDAVALTAEGVRAALLRALVALEGVAPVTADETTTGSGPATGTPQALAQALAADQVLSSRLECATEVCRIVLEGSRAADGQLLWIEPFEVPIDDLPLLTTAAATALQRMYPDHRPRAGVSALAVAHEDYARYLRVEHAFRSRAEGTDLETMLGELAAIRSSSPRFLEAYLLEARLASLQHHDTRDPADLERAHDRLRLAAALAPDDPRVADTRFSVAIGAQELDAAAAALATLERLTPGDTRVLARRALLLEQRGEGDQALALLRRAARQRPSWLNLLELANLEYRQGEIDAARRTLDGLHDRFPEDQEGLSLLAQIELLAGSPERAEALYQDLVAEAPRFGDLTNLGTAQLLLARYEEAEASFRRAAALAPNNPALLLNHADAVLLMGNEEEARDLYQRTVGLIADDPASTTSWQWQSIRAQALAHLGADRDAAAAIHAAQQLSPDNPQVAYEAALVYAVIGDEASAQVSAERALEGGVEARWFRFPWFDALRRHPALAARLTPP